VPALLFVFSLIVAVSLESVRQDLTPFRLKLTQREKYLSPKKINSQLFTLALGFSTLFICSFLLAYPLVIGALISSSLIVVLGLFLPHLANNSNNKYKLFNLFSLFVRAVKSNLDLTLICAVVSLLILLIEQFNLSSQLFLLIKGLLLELESNSFFTYLLLLLMAIFSLMLGTILPLPAVFFISISLTLPLFQLLKID